MGLRVAIVGLSESSRHLAPWDGIGWELWGLAWDSQRYTFDRVFEMHDLADLQQTYPNLPEYLAKLEPCRRLYMASEVVHGATVYPFDAVADDVGDYWTSSLAYAISLAIHEGAEEIGLFGIDANDDYGYQRPNLEYLIGFARGRGIKVTVPEVSPLCKHLNPPDRDYRGRYGRS